MSSLSPRRAPAPGAPGSEQPMPTPRSKPSATGVNTEKYLKNLYDTLSSFRGSTRSMPSPPRGAPSLPPTPSSWVLRSHEAAKVASAGAPRVLVAGRWPAVIPAGRLLPYDFVGQEWLPPEGRVVSIAAGDGCAVVVVSSAEVDGGAHRILVVGANSTGQLGTGDCSFVARVQEISSSFAELDVPGDIAPRWGESRRQVEAVACGRQHTMFIVSGGRLFACGSNGSGQLGVGDTTDRSRPTPVAIAFPHRPGRSVDERAPVLQVACGAAHTLAIATAPVDADKGGPGGSVSGVLYSWGCGGSGRLGLGDVDDVTSPTVIDRFESENGMAEQLASGTNEVAIFAISAGGAHSAAVSTVGALYTWGDGGDGRLGTGSRTSLLCPRRVSFGRKFANLTMTGVACGDRHTIAFSDAGRLFSWGRGANGVLGRGNMLDSFVPQEVQLHGASAVQRVACGSSHSAAIDASGTVWMWGEATFGKLCNGDEVSHAAVPTIPDPLRGQRVQQLCCCAHGTVLVTVSDMTRAPPKDDIGSAFHSSPSSSRAGGVRRASPGKENDAASVTRLVLDAARADYPDEVILQSVRIRDKLSPTHAPPVDHETLRERGADGDADALQILSSQRTQETDDAPRAWAAGTTSRRASIGLEQAVFLRDLVADTFPASKSRSKQRKQPQRRGSRTRKRRSAKPTHLTIDVPSPKTQVRAPRSARIPQKAKVASPRPKSTRSPAPAVGVHQASGDPGQRFDLEPFTSTEYARAFERKEARERAADKLKRRAVAVDEAAQSAAQKLPNSAAESSDDTTTREPPPTARPATVAQLVLDPGRIDVKHDHVPNKVKTFEEMLRHQFELTLSVPYKRRDGAMVGDAGKRAQAAAAREHGAFAPPRRASPRATPSAKAMTLAVATAARVAARSKKTAKAALNSAVAEVAERRLKQIPVAVAMGHFELDDKMHADGEAQKKAKLDDDDSGTESDRTEDKSTVTATASMRTKTKSSYRSMGFGRLHSTMRAIDVNTRADELAWDAEKEPSPLLVALLRAHKAETTAAKPPSTRLARRSRRFVENAARGPTEEQADQIAKSRTITDKLFREVMGSAIGAADADALEDARVAEAVEQARTAGFTFGPPEGPGRATVPAAAPSPSPVKPTPSPGPGDYDVPSFTESSQRHHAAALAVAAKRYEEIQEHAARRGSGAVTRIDTDAISEDVLLSDRAPTANKGAPLATDGVGADLQPTAHAQGRATKTAAATRRLSLTKESKVPRFSGKKLQEIMRRSAAGSVGEHTEAELLGATNSDARQVMSPQSATSRASSTPAGISRVKRGRAASQSRDEPTNRRPQSSKSASERGPRVRPRPSSAQSARRPTLSTWDRTRRGVGAGADGAVTSSTGGVGSEAATRQPGPADYDPPASDFEVREDQSVVPGFTFGSSRPRSEWSAFEEGDKTIQALYPKDAVLPASPAFTIGSPRGGPTADNIRFRIGRTNMIAPRPLHQPGEVVLNRYGNPVVPHETPAAAKQVSGAESQRASRGMVRVEQQPGPRVAPRRPASAPPRRQGGRSRFAAQFGRRKADG